MKVISWTTFALRRSHDNAENVSPARCFCERLAYALECTRMGKVVQPRGTTGTS
jgi:hypothetical protein